MKTKNGIELNLYKSDYIIETKNLRFYFSSELYKNKFNNEKVEFIQMENTKIINKYKIKIDLFEYLCVALYKRIEKRGFLVYDKLQELYFTESENFIGILDK